MIDADEWTATRENTAHSLEANLPPVRTPKTSPTPFVIVGMPRTGSTLLLTGIAQHPEIVAYGELLHPIDTERNGPHAIVSNGVKISLSRNQDAIAFLLNEVYGRAYPDNIRSVGFKVFGEHLKTEGTERFFLRLKETFRRLRVVHIARENYLDVLVSREIARQTGEWVRYSDGTGSKPQSEQFSISVEAAQRFFDNMQKVDRFFSKFFAGEQYLHVPYSKISNSYLSTMSEVYKFLDVFPFVPTEKIKKQVDRTTEDLVTNFDDLRRHFKGSPYEEFFSP